jgi:hypothetical protein
MKKIICGFIVFLLAICSVWAQNSNISLSIKFYNKQIYYSKDGSIYIQLTITNNSPELYRFRISEDRVFSIDFDTRTQENRAVEAAGFVVRRRSESSQVFFREMELESGESFSFVEDLRNYSQLDKEGSYIVSAKLYPELIRNQDRSRPQPLNNGMFVSTSATSAAVSSAEKPIVSNRLSLQIRPPAINDEDGVPVALSVETGAVLVRERLAPDDVISWTLHARQRSQWEKFFLYLDLEAMIARDGGRGRQWRAESEEGRRKMLATYQSDLKAARIDGDIVSIPSEFQIERTNYNETEGTVIVQERFKYSDFTERKRYTYYLERRAGIWIVVDYSVINLGTE